MSNRVVKRTVCLFLEYYAVNGTTFDYTKHYIKVFEMFPMSKDCRPLGVIRTYELGNYVGKNKYADWTNFTNYPYGGLVLIEETSETNSNGMKYRFIDYENLREDAIATLANRGYGRKQSINFYKNYNICIHYFKSSAVVDVNNYNLVSLTHNFVRPFNNLAQCSIMEYPDYGLLPDCVMTVEKFRKTVKELKGNECIEGISVNGYLVKLK